MRGVAMGNTYVAISLMTLLALAAGTSPTFALDYDQARALASSARVTAREVGVTTELEKSLASGVTECTGGPEGVPCRAVLRFTLGALAEYRAAAEPAERVLRLNQATVQYDAILAETPD